MADFDNVIIKSLDRFTMRSAVSGDIYFIADDLQNATLSSGEETVYGTGKSNRRISALKRNKTCGISFDNAFVSLGQLATQFGTEVTYATTDTLIAPKVELISVVVSTDPTAITSQTADGTSGAEIKVAYKANSDGTPNYSVKFTQGATAADKVFTYTPGTKTLAFASTGTGLVEGDKLVVVYNYKTKGKQIINDSDSFSKNGEGILECTVTSACDKETAYYASIVLPNLDASGQFDLALGGDQTIHSFSGESIPNPCTGGVYYTLVIPDNA